jgi:hypothetical protein
MKVSEIIKTWVSKTRKSAIKDYCLECAGGTTSEVTLCGMTHCPLWGYRFGNCPTSNTFKIRMETVKSSKPDEFKDAYAHLEEKTSGRES